jgi:prepilin signal peptidase PulO-like enzyme (type II secretory pathway)
MVITIAILLFILWTIFGSFGGVIIERAKEWFAWNERWKVFGWRSYCPWCDGELLVWWQLIPLLWWLIQRGKCFRCKLPIPQWYCWIELIMGGVFVITGLWVVWVSDPLLVLQSMGWELIGWLMVSWLLTLIVIHDLRTQELNLYAWVLLFVTSVILIFTMDASIWTAWFIWAIVLVAVFGCIYLGAKRYATKKNDGIPTEWFGEWDVMVALLLGLLSGPLIAQWWLISSIQMIFVYLVLSSSLWIIWYLVSQWFVTIHDRKIPFLPAMIIAWWVIAVWQVIA